MGIKEENGLAYLQVLKHLHAIINEEYQKGGNLPTSRVMCEKMGVNRVTYNKAVGRLIAENIATSRGRGGTYVFPKNLRPNKVGIIIANAEKSPFLSSNCRSVSGAIDSLYKAKRNFQIISANSVDGVKDQLVLHGITSALWFFPNETALQNIVEMKDDKTNIVIVDFPSYLYLCKNKHLLQKINHVGNDMAYMYHQFAEFCGQRRYKNILYTGTFKIAKEFGLIELLSKKGCELLESNCVDASQMKVEALERQLIDNRIDAIISEGAGLNQEKIFQACHNIEPDASSPKILARELYETSLISKKYPKAKLVGLAKIDTHALGVEAVNTLIALNKDPKCPVTKVMSLLSIEDVT